MVERNLAKVEVASSSLVSRSKGSNSELLKKKFLNCPGGGIGRRAGLKILLSEMTVPVRCRSRVRKIKNAGVAQLVERNLAKVEVASSSLVSRSNISKK